MTEIDPCAFCGEYDGECAVSGVPNHQGKRKFAVYCNGCFSEGPPAETKEEAIAAWNRRATPAPAQPDSWHDAVLAECMAIEGAYKSDDPTGTLRSLIDWHVMNERSPSPAAAPAEGAAWQPIESVPGTEEPVLLWTRAGKVRVETGWYAKNLLEESKEDDFECSFTHWRPPLAGPASQTPAQEGKP